MKLSKYKRNNLQMAPHKRVASLLQICSALISHQLLLLLIGKENIEDGEDEVKGEEKEEEEEENVISPREEGEVMVRRRRREKDSKGKDETSELGNNDLVEILASLGLLTGMMETVLDSLNSRIGMDKM